jgi:hypothetical protein
VVNPFEWTPQSVDALWEKHGLKPFVGDIFAWPDETCEGPPIGASIIGVILVEQLGWSQALAVYLFAKPKAPTAKPMVRRRP